MQTPFAPAPYWSSAVGTLRLYRGDCRDVLASLPRETFACCVTSPPYYGLRDYGLPPAVWGGEKGCRHDFSVSHRVKKSGGTGKTGLMRDGRRDEARLSNQERIIGSTSFQAETATCRRCGAWRGSLGLEPTPALYAAHLVECLRHVRDALHPLGTLWLNLGDSFAQAGGSEAAGNSNRDGMREAPTGFRNGQAHQRSGSRQRSTLSPGFKLKDLLGVPWRVAFALQDDGWYLRMDCIWNKTNPMPESVTDRPAKAHEYVFLLSKSKTYYYDHEVVKEPATQPRGLARTAGRQEKQEQLGRRLKASTLGTNAGSAERNLRSVWTFATQPYKDAHFATFPEELARRCLLAGCPPGAWALDPFCGSGTTLAVAASLGRRAVGVEASEEYLRLAVARARKGVRT
jgi:DNA modification methylase